MASAMALKLSCVVLLCMIVGAPVATAVISCGQVTSNLASCFAYITGPAPQPAPACCAGIKNLNGAAKTTPDRQQVCNCLKGIARANPRINISKASGLPSKCGVSVPYKIDPNTDCTKVQ